MAINGCWFVVQEQVEQNLAVRCMQSVGTMLATLRIDQGEQVTAQLLEKLEMMGMISAEGRAVAAEAVGEQYRAVRRQVS